MQLALPMTLKIPAEFERAVLERVESGQYESAEAVFSACLEALRREENDPDARLAWLRRELDVAIDEAERGEVIDGEQAFAEALAEFRQRTGR
jgi:Arc/MetJ-type ribon-helix-helix transcriptional regulator